MSKSIVNRNSKLCFVLFSSLLVASCSGDSGKQQGTIQQSSSPAGSAPEKQGHLRSLLDYPAKTLRQGLLEYQPRQYEGHRPTANAYFAAANAALDARDYGSAEVLLDEVIRLEPANGRAYYLRGRARCNAFSQKDQEALADLKKAVSLGVVNSSIYEYQARIYDGAKQKDKAVEALTQAIKLSPRDQKFYRWRASLYFDSGNKKQAKTDYDKAISLDPESPYLRLLRAQLLESMARYDEALADYAKAAEYDSGRDRVLKRGAALKGWAVLLKKMGKSADAIVVLNKGIAMDKSDDELLKLRGDNYAALKKFDAAIKDYSKAIELGPSISGAVFVARGRAYHAIGRDDLAQKDSLEAKNLSDAPAERPVYKLENAVSTE
ncbi:MAG: tetratricopeptide repeat protein [Candidatus Melainabacteria bacterium]|nr:tetratricopeptide repeat protein [Candidatus Melainabacteria bacterium]